MPPGDPGLWDGDREEMCEKYKVGDIKMKMVSSDAGKNQTKQTFSACC